jgi:hypothetical protein
MFCLSPSKMSQELGHLSLDIIQHGDGAAVFHSIELVKLTTLDTCAVAHTDTMS